MSDDAEDPVDPRPEIVENCKPKCFKQLLQYKACAKRVEEDDTGSKQCVGQYFDYWGCIDKCAAPKIFNKLNFLKGIVASPNSVIGRCDFLRKCSNFVDCGLVASGDLSPANNAISKLIHCRDVEIPCLIEDMI